MTTSWVPVNENHAIEVMGAVVRFSNPLPDLVYRRALKNIGPAAEKLGLSSIGPSQRMQIKFGNDGLTQTPAPSPPGQTFSRRSDPTAGANEPFKLLEQIQFEPEMLVYRSWDYVSWKWQFARIKEAFAPILDVINDTVVFEALSLEYLDRFRDDGVDPSALASLLKRDSDLIAPHIFDARGLFHSHTGFFLRGGNNGGTLQVVRVEGHEAEGKRWIHIATTQEHRFSREADGNPEPFALLDAAHDDLKVLLGKLITDEQAKLIYLQS